MRDQEAEEGDWWRLVVMRLERRRQPGIEEAGHGSGANDDARDGELQLVFVDQQQAREHQRHEQRDEQRLDRRVRHRNSELLGALERHLARRLTSIWIDAAL